MALNVFLSYNFDDEPFVGVVTYLLNKQPDLKAFCYSNERRGEGWPQFIMERLNEADSFVFFLGKSLGVIQENEILTALEVKQRFNNRIVAVCMGDASIPGSIKVAGGRFDPVNVSGLLDDAAEAAARGIAQRLAVPWVPADGIPDSYIFEHEKEIIVAYRQRHSEPNGRLEPRLLQTGCPPNWPRVVKQAADSEIDGEIQEKIGNFRNEGSHVMVDTRTECAPDQGWCELPSGSSLLTFPEAGPRKAHFYPRPEKVELNVAILVSGGIAPGINAVIDGIVKRHELYQKESLSRRPYVFNAEGLREGLRSLVQPSLRKVQAFRLSSSSIQRQAEMGGSVLPTSRFETLVKADSAGRDRLLGRMVSKLDGVDILYVIGGDGSLKVAHALWKKAQDMKSPLSVVGIPKTMDNDILWVWQSFGFLSAVERAREAVLNLHTEARSNPRLCILQLFGSDSGFVASHAGLASGLCDAVLIPEVPYTMAGLFAHVSGALMRRFREGSPHALIIMAETAIPSDADKYILDDSQDAKNSLGVRLSADEKREVEDFIRNKRRVSGQTPDSLRTGGLRIVKGVLEKMIEKTMQPNDYWGSFRVFTSEPRHLIRSVSPSVSDVIFAERLGALAVDNAMAGYTDFMVSQWLTEFVLVPLELVVLGRKRVPRKGIFWKSVLASTGQPDKM